MKNDYTLEEHHTLLRPHSEGFLEALVMDMASILIIAGYVLVLIGHILHTFVH